MRGNSRFKSCSHSHRVFGFLWCAVKLLPGLFIVHLLKHLSRMVLSLFRDERVVKCSASLLVGALHYRGFHDYKSGAYALYPRAALILSCGDLGLSSLSRRPWCRWYGACCAPSLWSSWRASSSSRSRSISRACSFASSDTCGLWSDLDSPSLVYSALPFQSGKYIRSITTGSINSLLRRSWNLVRRHNIM